MMNIKKFNRFSPILLAISLLSISGCQSDNAFVKAVPRSDLAHEVFRLVNLERMMANKGLLVWQNRMSELAEAHSLEMADGQTAFGHDGFYERVELLRQSLQFSAAGENVGYTKGHTNPISVMISEWLLKEDHRSNMLGLFDLSGVGVAEGPDGALYITQIFVRSI